MPEEEVERMFLMMAAKLAAMREALESLVAEHASGHIVCNCEQATKALGPDSGADLLRELEQCRREHAR